MAKIRTLFATLIAAFIVIGAVAPANASSATVWSTSSSNKYVGSVLQPQIVRSGGVTVTAWMVRTGSETSKLYAKVKDGSTWAANELVATFPYDWWSAFKLAVTDSGNIYIGVANSDYPLTVYKRGDSNTWTSTVVDSDPNWSLGTFKVGGSSSGAAVTFTTTVQASESSVTLKTWTINENDQTPTWASKTVKTVSRNSGDFSACSYRPSIYSSCAVRLETPQILELLDGSQILLVSGYRDSSNGNLPGTQFKTFKAHRADYSADWIWDGSFLTQTMASKDSSYAYFTTPAVVAGNDNWAVAVTTGTTTTKVNTVRLFTATGSTELPVASDAVKIQNYGTSESPVLLADSNEIRIAFQSKGKHYYGTVGQLNSAVRLSHITSSQDIKNLVIWGNVVSAVVQTSKSATYVTQNINGTWTRQAKVMSYGNASSLALAPTVVVASTELFVIAPKFNGKRVVGLVLGSLVSD